MRGTGPAHPNARKRKAMKWFATSMICHLLGHKWGAWTQQQSWDGQGTFEHRKCMRHGCLATQQRREK